MESGSWQTVIVIAALSGAVSGFVGGVASSWATQSFPWMGRAAKSILGRINALRRFLGLARKHTRQRSQREFWSSRHRASLRTLRATVFRWYEASPSTDWPYVLGVYTDHTDEGVREYAKRLLWREKTIGKLDQRDRFMSSKECHHVALAHPCPDGSWWVLTNLNAHSSLHFVGRRADETIQVNRGWCSNRRGCDEFCQFCDMPHEDMQHMVQKELASHDCREPGGS